VWVWRGAGPRTDPRSFTAQKGLEIRPYAHELYRHLAAATSPWPRGLTTAEAGLAFYWAPGHSPSALEDCPYIDFSPTDERAGYRACAK
jgi:hypothetical protein